MELFADAAKSLSFPFQQELKLGYRMLINRYRVAASQVRRLPDGEFEAACSVGSVVSLCRVQSGFVFAPVLALPSFSIIVPVYEHWNSVPALLEALQRQSWRGEFEVLLVDNDSSDRCEYPELPSFARILRCEQAGSYAARNAGIAAARGDWLVFTDADCVPDADWLMGFDQAITRGGTEPAIYAGRVQVRPLGGERPNLFQIYDMVKGIPQRHYVRRGYGATANLCVAREIVTRIGLFDARRFSGGDAELCRRATRYGYSLNYVADASVVHPARDSWQALVTKTRRVKGGQLLFGPIHRRIHYLIRTFLPPLLAISRFLSQSDHPWWYRVVAVGVQLRIWLVDMREALRLATGATPERR